MSAVTQTRRSAGDPRLLGADRLARICHDGEVSYFSAVIGRGGSAGWRALDVDIEDCESLDELADLLRPAGANGPVLAVLEHEDEWFALVRVDDESDEWRAFVSDQQASQGGRYAEVLAPVADDELAEYVHLHTGIRGARDGSQTVEDEAPHSGDAGGDDDPLLAATAADFADASREAPELTAWSGDPGLLSDIGVSAAELVELVEATSDDPGAVVAELGERCGFDQLLDALR